MNKGVIVQLDTEKAYILKNDGSFIAYPRDTHWVIGDVISLPGTRNRIWKRALISCAAVFIILLCSTGVLYNIPETYIEITVNPSIQLILNRFGRVLNFTGLNADGIDLFQGVSYKNLTLDEASARIFNRLENNGFLRDNTILLVVANDSQKELNKVEQALRNVSEKYIRNNKTHMTIQRYAIDEYKALSHPLPVRDMPDSPTPTSQPTLQPKIMSPTTSPTPTAASTPTVRPIPPASPAPTVIPTPQASAKPTVKPTTPTQTEPIIKPTQHAIAEPTNSSTPQASVELEISPAPTADPEPGISPTPTIILPQPQQDDIVYPDDSTPTDSVVPHDNTQPSDSASQDGSHENHEEHNGSHH